MEDHQRELEIEKRLTRLEAKMDEVKELIASSVVSQIRDHGKRLPALERRQIWIGGWVAGAGAALAAVIQRDWHVLISRDGNSQVA